jgi:glutathione S-transferase
MIKLYGIPASRAFRSLWALEEIGLEYERVPVHYISDSKKPEYLKVNPNGRIPALVDGDVTLFESMAINLYLAKKYDGGLQPKTLEDEARAVQWSFWGMTELEPPLMQILMNRVLLPEDQRDPAAAEAGVEALQKPLGVLNDALSDRPFLLGPAFSIADLNVASVLSVAAFARFEFSKFENAQRWFSSCASRPAVGRAQSD